MKGVFLIVIIAAFFQGCGSKADNMTLQDQIKQDEYVEKRLIELGNMVMSIDTATNIIAPVRITESRVNKDFNGAYTNEVLVEYFNKSGKEIDGLRMGFYLFNNFSEPVTNGASNSFTIETQKVLKAGEKSVALFDISNFHGTTKVYGFVKEVHFIDGTTWKNADFKKH